MSDEHLILQLKEWLGEDGISFFREIKEKHGTVNAIWMEGEEDRQGMTELRKAIHRATGNGIPHPVHFREGMQVRNFLRKATDYSWTDHEYDNKLTGLVEEAII